MRRIIKMAMMASGWNPKQIPGLEIWLDASDLSTLYQDSAKTTPVASNADPVGCWADKSGNGGDFVQATTAYRPLFGTAAARFPGVHPLTNTVPRASFIRTQGVANRFLTGTISARTYRTIFLVARAAKTPHTGNAAVITFANNAEVSYYNAAPTGWRFYPNAAWGVRQMATDVFPAVSALTMIVNNTTLTGYTQENYDTAPYAITDDLKTATRFILGVTGTGGSGQTKTDFYALLTYSRVLTTAEITRVQQYLAQRYLTIIAPKTWTLPWISRQNVLNASTDDDALVIQEPTVFVDTNAQILTGTVFKMWFSQGWTAAQSNICYAESSDGITWMRAAGHQLTNYARSFVVKVGATYYMYALELVTQSQDVYTSSDGVTWGDPAATAILAGGGGNCAVFEDGGEWKMIYEYGSPGVLYLATSADGIVWTPHSANTIVISLIDTSVGGPSIYKLNGMYYMWIHVGNEYTEPTDVARYVSSDLIHWTCLGYILMRSDTDEGPNRNGQIADPCIVHVGNQIYAYYTATTNADATSGDFHIKLAICPDTWLT